MIIRYALPTVTLNTPTNNQVFAHNASILASGTVANATSPSVTFWTNNTVDAYAQSGDPVTAAPYTNLLGVLNPGSYKIYARLIDNSGATTNYSATNTFVVKAAPSVYVTEPTNTQQYTAVEGGAGIDVTAVVSNGIGPFSVQFYTNGATAGSAVTTAPYTNKLGALGAGSYQIYAEVTDNGNIPVDTATSATNDFTVEGAALAVILNAPTNNAEFPFDATIAATATVYEAVGSTNVTFWTNTVGDYAQVGASGSSNPYDISFAAPAPGEYHIYAVVSDDNGSATSATHTITVLAAPTVTLAALEATYEYGVSITATATCANGVSPYSVQFYTNSTLEGTYGPAGSADIEGPDYTVTFATLFPDEYFIYAEVTDAYLDTARTVTNSFTVNSPSDPDATLEWPTNNQSFWFGSSITATSTVSGGTPVNSVQFYTNGTTAGLADTNDPYTVTLSGLPIGSHTIYATVTDAENRQDTTLTNTFYVTPQPPEIFVATNGTHEWPFANWTTAATNIQAAIDASAFFSTLPPVTVSNGTYTITAQISITNGITVRSFANGVYGGLANAAVTTVRRDDSGGNHRIFNITHANAVLDGLSITNGYPKNADGGGVYMTGGTVSNCIVRNNRAANDNQDFDGGGIYALGNSRIVNCRILSNIAGGNKIANRGGGVYSKDATVTIRNCLIANNNAVQKGGGVYLENGRIENCTIVGNWLNGAHVPADGAGGGVYRAAGTVSNSIVYFNTIPAASTTGHTNINTTAGLAYSCTVALGNTSAGNIQDDPKFVDWANGDYTLAANSPCIDTGSNQTWMDGALDLAGNTRKQWGRVFGSKAAPIVDMGAYEFLEPSPPGTIFLLR